MSNRWDAKTMKTPRRVIHCIAQCAECAFNSDDYKNAARLASKHARMHRHIVTVEQGITYKVKPN